MVVYFFLFVLLSTFITGCGTPIQAREVSSVEFTTNIDCSDYEVGDINLDKQIDGYDLSMLTNNNFLFSQHKCPDVLDVDQNGLFQITLDSMALEVFLARRYL